MGMFAKLFSFFIKTKYQALRHNQQSWMRRAGISPFRLKHDVLIVWTCLLFIYNAYIQTFSIFYRTMVLLGQDSSLGMQKLGMVESMIIQNAVNFVTAISLCYLFHFMGSRAKKVRSISANGDHSFSVLAPNYQS